MKGNVYEISCELSPNVNIMDYLVIALETFDEKEKETKFTQKFLRNKKEGHSHII